MPEHLGKYRIEGVLGSGAMGVVYKAFDPHIQRAIALKTIRKELFSEHEEGELIARFRNEAQAAGRLTHPNIVAVYDYGEDGNTAYLAMEYVDGTPLSALLTGNKPVDPHIAVDWTSQLLQALAYAHTRGVIHRDIKPANLLLTGDGCVKITDFGVARIESSTLTRIGAVIGTPSYMSPEQFRGEAIDGRSDLFSAGSVLYQLLTGTRPFSGSASTIMRNILNEVPAKPSALNPALGGGFDAVLEQALAKSRDQRYPSALAFLHALRAARGGAAQRGTTQRGAGETAAQSGERTVLMTGHPGGPATTLFNTAIAGSAERTGDPGTLTATPWEIDTLSGLELALSRQIGPMAKLLLKKAAAQAQSFDELCKLLIPHIPSEKGLKQFLETAADLRKKLATLSPAGSAQAGLPSSSGASRLSGANHPRPALDPALVEAAERLLTGYIGPIARIVVKRAAARAMDKDGFFQELAESLPTHAEKTRFLSELSCL